MDQNNFQQIVSLLLDIKHSLQKQKLPEPSNVLFKLDKCISKLIPYVNSGYSVEQNAIPQELFNSEPRPKSMIVGRSSELSIDSDKFILYRKSADPQILKINQSFFRQSSPSLKSKKSLIQSSILQDFFILRYNLAYNDYQVYGKKHASTDRKVFVDLLTFDNKKAHTYKLQKTQSMTNVLRQIFSQSKPSKPFILPNFQEETAKYLFAFGMPECGSIARQYYRTETICCFVSQQFILSDLTQLMNQISRVCFQQQVNEASQAQDGNLSEAISLLHGKKTYQCMEEVIQRYLSRKQSESAQKILSSQIERPLMSSIQRYLQKNQEQRTFIKKGREQEIIITLVLLYYLTMSEYKIILIANTMNKHLISELILSLTRALHPLTYIYPIVGTTITHHHFQFANSPVPIFVGFWGYERDCLSAKRGLKKVINAQKQMSSEQLSTETLMAVIDLEDHSSMFYEGAFDEAKKICKKIQNYLETQAGDQASVKLSKLTQQMLCQGHRQQDWMVTLTKNMKVTQMYDYLINKNK